MRNTGAVRIRFGHPSLFATASKVQDVNDLQLTQLTVQELQELKDSIDTAIRAHIRARAEMKAQAVAPAAKARLAPIDLERERDAWMAAKRQGKPI